MSLEGSKLGLQTRLAEQEANISSLKQTLLRVTLAKQSLESEKNALLRRVEEMAAAGDSAQQDKLGGGGEPARTQQLYTEELRVARDAISNLRASFSEAAAEQHILDTLEQCVSVIVERQAAGAGGGDSKPGSRMSGSEVSDAGESEDRIIRISTHLSSVKLGNFIRETEFYCENFISPALGNRDGPQL